MVESKWLSYNLIQTERVYLTRAGININGYPVFVNFTVSIKLFNPYFLAFGKNNFPSILDSVDITADSK